MDDEQIVLLGRALDREHERTHQEGGNSKKDEENKIAYLLEHLGADIAQMTAENPQRGEELLTQLAYSDNPYERNIVLAAAIPLGLIDYELARELLFVVHELQKRDGDGDGATGWIDGLIDVLRQAGRHDQAADLERRWTEYWPEG
ncbi:hypothetical protein [Allorhizocola rhizosphaerae]|uniref:hypothetical protein n=1 Tax=Allorhizocola rhizosphaerae TaxID=1872709 RepID=UPI000E3E332B|nr:hypothetical protein [Allorhizocola rhizosphaerae]